MYEGKALGQKKGPITLESPTFAAMKSFTTVLGTLMEPTLYSVMSV